MARSNGGAKRSVPHRPAVARSRIPGPSSSWTSTTSASSRGLPGTMTVTLDAVLDGLLVLASSFPRRPLTTAALLGRSDAEMDVLVTAPAPGIRLASTDDTSPPPAYTYSPRTVPERPVRPLSSAAGNGAPSISTTASGVTSTRLVSPSARRRTALAHRSPSAAPAPTRRSPSCSRGSPSVPPDRTRGRLPARIPSAHARRRAYSAADPPAEAGAGRSGSRSRPPTNRRQHPTARYLP